MSSQEKYLELKGLNIKELKEICRNHDLRGYSSLKHDNLAKFTADNLDLSTTEVNDLVNTYWENKLVSKIKDAEDYILRKDVEIIGYQNDLIKAKAGKYKITIYNLGKKKFKYRCEGGCNDFDYNVKKHKYPFCKHYTAVIAELIYNGKLDPKKTLTSHISGKSLTILHEIIKKRKNEEGIELPKGRNIDNNLQNLKDDFIKISKQDDKLAREKYGENSTKIFKSLVNEAFKLLEFETIPQRREQGWDLLVLGTYAPNPYMAVIECKTAISGIYNINDPNYLVILKSYCIDMVKDKLIGDYKDYMKYMVIVAPDFPDEIVKFRSKFKDMTGGIQLSFLPASSLLYLVEKYREDPILTHYVSESIFVQGIITKEYIDKLFISSEEHIENLIKEGKKVLKKEMCDVNKCHADAFYIKLDESILNKIIYGIISKLQPYLLKQATNEDRY